MKIIQLLRLFFTNALKCWLISVVSNNMFLIKTMRQSICSYNVSSIERTHFNPQIAYRDQKRMFANCVVGGNVKSVLRCRKRARLE